MLKNRRRPPNASDLLHLGMVALTVCLMLLAAIKASMLAAAFAFLLILATNREEPPLLRIPIFVMSAGALAFVALAPALLAPFPLPPNARNCLIRCPITGRPYRCCLRFDAPAEECVRFADSLLAGGDPDDDDVEAIDLASCSGASGQYPYWMQTPREGPALSYYLPYAAAPHGGIRTWVIVDAIRGRVYLFMEDW